MRTEPLGRTGVPISVVGLGGFELGPETGEPRDIGRAISVVQTSMDAGINWIDTSENYHEEANEDLIGEALASVDGGFLVATKVAPGNFGSGGGSGFRPEQIRAACHGSLGRLRRDVIDVFFLHWPDDTGVPLEDTWGAMSELADKGLVRAIGMSNYELPDVERCHAQRRVDVVQTGLSLVDYLDDRPLIAGCGDLGIPVTIYEPVAGGVLAGQTLEELRRRWAAWQEMSFYERLLSPGKGERSMAVADGLGPIADRLNVTVAQLAIAWVLAQPGVAAAIVGSRDGKHIEENALAAQVDLGGAFEEIEALIPLGPAFAES